MRREKVRKREKNCKKMQKIEKKCEILQNFAKNSEKLRKNVTFGYVFAVAYMFEHSRGEGKETTEFFLVIYIFCLHILQMSYNL